jgi:hypothetical protein
MLSAAARSRRGCVRAGGAACGGWRVSSVGGRLAWGEQEGKRQKRGCFGFAQGAFPVMKVKIQGSLHSAADGETVRCCGRDDVHFVIGRDICEVRGTACCLESS